MSPGPLLAAGVSGAILLLLVRLFRLSRTPAAGVAAAPLAGAAAGFVSSVLLVSPVMSRGLVYAAAAIAVLTIPDSEDSAPLEGALAGSAAGATAVGIMLVERGPVASSALIIVLIAVFAGGLALASSRKAKRVALAALGSPLVLLGGAPPLEASVQLWWIFALIGLIALAGIGSETLRLRRMRAPLSEEAAWGILDERLLAHLTSGWRRLFTPAGFNPDLWRELARTSRRLASRRLRQAKMSPEGARVQQLEVVRLRTRLMELQKMHADADGGGSGHSES